MISYFTIENLLIHGCGSLNFIFLLFLHLALHFSSKFIIDHHIFSHFMSMRLVEIYGLVVPGFECNFVISQVSQSPTILPL